MRVFADTLSIALEPDAALYRIGGDEFIVLLGEDEVEAFYEAVDMAVLAARQVAQLRGVSVDVARSHEAQGAELIALANTRMYGVKQRRQTLATLRAQQ